MAKSNKDGWIHNMWYNENDLQRRTCLVLFCIFAMMPRLLGLALLTLVFAAIYIPFMAILYGAQGYNDALRNLSDVVDIPLDIQMGIVSIWRTHWDRLPVIDK